MSSLLSLPYEVRLLIYRAVFHDMTIFIRPRTNIKSRPCYAVETPNAYNILLTCHQCHGEARSVACETADFVYDSHSSITSLDKLCSAPTRAAMKYLYGMAGFEYMDPGLPSSMEALFPNLEILGISLNTENMAALTPQQYNIVPYDAIVDLIQRWDARYAQLMQILENARFRTFIQVAVMIVFFGDNSRDVEQVQILRLDVRQRELIRESINIMSTGGKQPMDVYNWAIRPH